MGSNMAAGFLYVALNYHTDLVRGKDMLASSPGRTKDLWGAEATGDTVTGFVLADQLICPPCSDRFTSMALPVEGATAYWSLLCPATALPPLPCLITIYSHNLPQSNVIFSSNPPVGFHKVSRQRTPLLLCEVNPAYT